MLIEESIDKASTPRGQEKVRKNTLKAKKFFKFNKKKTNLDQLIKIMMDSELKKVNGT